MGRSLQTSWIFDNGASLQYHWLHSDPTKYHSLLHDSRSYASTETSSDHRLVVFRVWLRNLYRLWKKGPTINADRVAVSEIVHQKPRFIEYVHGIRESLTAAALHQQANKPAQHRLDTVRHIVMSAAWETVGAIAPHSNHSGNHYDSDIAAKTSEQRNLRLCISSCKDEQTMAGLEQKRKQIQQCTTFLWSVLPCCLTSFKPRGPDPFHHFLRDIPAVCVSCTITREALVQWQCNKAPLHNWGCGRQ